MLDPETGDTTGVAFSTFLSDPDVSIVCLKEEPLPGGIDLESEATAGRLGG